MHPDFVNAVELLPMPAGAQHDLAKFEGTACAWCSVKPSLVLKLGPRVSPVQGKLERWHPIGCRPCVRLEAARVYAIHVRSCARCSHRDYCLDSRALLRLAGGGR